MFVYQYTLKGQPGNGTLQFDNLLANGEQFDSWVEQAVIADLQSQGETIGEIVGDKVAFSIQLIVES